MTNRVFQGVINQLSGPIGKMVGIIDDGGNVVACNDPSHIGEIHEEAANDLIFGAETTTSNGWLFRALVGATRFEYAVFVEGTDEEADRAAQLVSISIGNIKQYYDEKYDRTNFIKNVIMDNILPGDIFLKARELHLSGDVSRVVLLIRIANKDEISAFDVIQNLFPDKNKDFVINVNDTDIALVKQTRAEIETKDLEKLGRSIVDTLAGEFYTQATVGIGTTVTGIRDLARSFKEAQVAMDVGKVFETERTIISYDNLGVARLIYQLPRAMCEMFLKEVFKKGTLESLDQETLFTIQKFFENNLNVSETSRKLFVHRNTLVYRLEKIKKITGLDLRELDHAIVFKVAMMVRKYLGASGMSNKF